MVDMNAYNQQQMYGAQTQQQQFGGMDAMGGMGGAGYGGYGMGGGMYDANAQQYPQQQMMQQQEEPQAPPAKPMAFSTNDFPTLGGFPALGAEEEPSANEST
jgi:hypothetical protein